MVSAKSWLLLMLFAVAATAETFPIPEKMQPAVNFWTRVYSEWTADQVVLCDMEDFRMIYGIVNLPPFKEDPTGYRRQMIVESARRDVARALNELFWLDPTSEDRLTGLTRELYLALKDIDRPDKYRRVDMIRAQTGMKNRFKEGYIRSGAYDEEIKKRLRANGLPEDLIAIVFVESMFHPGARSKVGAGGIWQFMKRTAKEYMHVNHLVDERFDPILATEAASRYFKIAIKELGEWPLVITSYNYGRGGMRKASQIVGSKDLGEIIERYDGPRFGFAAKNYYAEFLAALDVYKRADEVFPDVAKHPHWDYHLVKLPKPMSLIGLIEHYNVDKEWLLRHNPAITPNTRHWKTVLPKGFTLRVPKEKADTIVAVAKVDKEPEPRKNEKVSYIIAKHRASGRQSMLQIAKKYRVSYSQLVSKVHYGPRARPKKGAIILVRSQATQPIRFSDLPAAMHAQEASAKEAAIATDKDSI